MSANGSFRRATDRAVKELHERLHLVDTAEQKEKSREQSLASRRHLTRAAGYASFHSSDQLFGLHIDTIT